MRRRSARMDQAIKDSCTARVYDARDALVEQYADLAHDKDLIARMTAANELIRKAVTIDTTRRAAERSSPPGSARPADQPGASQRPRSTRSRLRRPKRSFIALADGYAYALHGLTGAPLWQPAAGPGGAVSRRSRFRATATVVAIDARYNELVRFDAQTGALQVAAFARRARRRPAPGPGKPARPGAAQRKAASDRARVGRARVDRQPGPAAGSLAGERRGRASTFTCWAGRTASSCWRESRCRASRSSIWDMPTLQFRALRRRLGRFLVVPENDSLYNSRFHVLVLDQDGAKVRPVQDVDVSGWTWQTPASSRPDRLGAGRQGGIRSLQRGRLHEQDAVSLAGQADCRFGVYRAGVRAGAVGSRAVGGFGAFGTIRPRPRARRDRAPSRRSSSRVRRWHRSRRRESSLIMTFQDQASGGRRALGDRPRFERRGLEDDRRRALGRRARSPAQAAAFA